MSSDSSLHVPESNPASLKEQALILFQKGERDEALEVFENAANAYALSGDLGGEAEMQNNMGVIYRLKRDWPRAVAALEQAEAGFLAAGDDRRRGQVLGNLGDLYASRHDYQGAAEYYSESSSLLARSGEGDLQGQVLRTFSLMRLRQRRWIESVDLMAQSIEVREHPSMSQRLLYYLLQIARKLLKTS